MNCPSCNEEARIGSIYCHSCGEPLENIFRQELENRALTQDIPVVDEKAVPKIPVCDHCDRQDETLRIVTYPFVVSFVIFTSRESFKGLMCKKHQNLYLTLASVITATVGWLGIPRGITYTPVALFQLAHGGDKPRDDNVQMLESLAKHKYSQGDTEEAIKCLEACLQFGENAEIWQEIQYHRTKLFIAEKENRLRTIISITFTLLFGAALIGATVGTLDYVLTRFFFSALQGEIPVFLTILSWSSFVAMAFIGGLAIYQLIEWVIRRIHLRNFLIAVGIGGLGALVAAYSIGQAESLSDYVYHMFMGGISESQIDVIYGVVLVILIGGFLWIFMLINDVSAGSIIFLVLMAVILVYYLGMAMRSAIETVRWQKRLIVKDSFLLG